MRYTESFIKTNKEAKEFESVNATLLQKAGFVDQTMAGVYTFLPLGLRVLEKIEDVIRDEMDNIGTEMLMPALSPVSLWQQTDRLEKVNVLFEARGANDASRQKNDARYILNPTHEEIIGEIASRLKPSYKDLPFAVYQIQTKFRNEVRPKSGLLRGREFRMKDLYSFHASASDFEDYYGKAKDYYMNIFSRLGIGDDTVVALASGGDFTNEYSHEFDTRCDSGEDEIFYDEANNIYWNKEVASQELQDKSESIKVAEVGNIFPLGTKFAEAFGHFFMDEKGERLPVHMASYGIGSSRIMGVLVEKFHDERGILWPDTVAPWQAHLVGLNIEDAKVSDQTEKTYANLVEAGVEVLFDERPDTAAGEKLSDADLIGCPWRVVVSKKTGDKIEIKRRDEEKTRLATIGEFVRLLS